MKPFHQLTLYRTMIPWGLCVLSPAGALAFESGAWRANGLEVPARFHETFVNQATMATREGANADAQPVAGELLVDTRFSSDFAIDGVNLNMNGGLISGDRSGTYAAGQLGRMELTIEGESITGYVNISNDAMVVPPANNVFYSPHIATRLPAALVAADLAGTWHVLVLTLPNDLTEVYRNQVTMTTREGAANSSHPLTNEKMLDAYFKADPALEQIAITISSAGNITGDATGTAVANADKSVTLNITGAGPMIFYPNAACDMLTSVHTDEEANPCLVLAVKAPQSVAAENMQGVWRAQSINFPAQLIRTYYNTQTHTTRTTWASADRARNYEILVDVGFSDWPEVTNELLSIDAAGQASGSVTGSVSVSNGTVMFTPSDGAPVVLRPNASGTFVMAADVSGDSIGLITLVKVAATPATSLDQLVGLKLAQGVGSNAVPTWNEASSLILARSEDLINWTLLPETLGMSSYVDIIGSSKAFYRVERFDSNAAPPD